MAPPADGHDITMPANGSVARKTLRVLGLDPALAGATGYGVVELDGQAARMLRFGALRFPARANFPERLREIHQMVAQLVEEFAPDAIAVESVFAALNMRTALRLAEVRGVILLAAAQADIPAHSYSPREVKASVTGFGGASKLQMQQMIKAQLGLCEQPEPADAADALAVALCHAHFARAAERLERNMVLNPAPGISRARSRSHFSAARIPIQR
ncbi:MAG TPA: crossover junction endodeoxyribonuclease RuvC [Candidatus Acidoferrales bacterium]|nr:crossover junction endodeoxyribonuclease RuvC [Candidatus Acidoferrales bacterium]